MKNIKALKRIISFTLSIVIASSAAKAYPFHVNNNVKAKTLAEIQAERDANKQKIAEYEAQLATLSNDKDNNEKYQATLMKQIELFKANIDSLNAEIESISKDIEDAENNIKAIDDSIVQMQKDIDDGVEKFKKRLYSIYVSSDSSLAGVILGSSSFSDMVANKEMLKRIADYDKELIDDILDNIEKIEESKKQLEAEKRTLEMKKSDQQKRKEEKSKELESYSEKMKQTQDELDRIQRELDATNNSIDTLKEINAALDAEEGKIETEIRRQKELAQKRYEEEQRKNQQQQQQQQPSNGGNSQPIVIPPPSGDGFMWPTPGFCYISSPFGYRWGRLHGGIDIGDAGIHGGSVVASRSGTVIAVNNSCSHDYYKTSTCGCGGGYGNYVTIAHDGTYSTHYAHLASAAVSVGDYVQQGQVIGYVGCTGFSMGSHLHFEIYVNGSRQDPLGFVSP